jgi:hypothetical protein
MGTSQIWGVPYSLVAKDVAGPLAKLGITGTTDVMDEALFEVKNKAGNTVFAVYNEGIRAYVGNGKAKGIKGGFSVGGYDATKGSTIYDLFTLSTDSARLYFDSKPAGKGIKGGFSIGGYDMTKGGIPVQNYLTVNKDSVRIYIDSNPATKGIKGGFSVGGYDMTKGVTGEYFNVSGESDVETINGEPRVLWYPAKEAFRSGNVFIESKDSVGLNSWASGYRSKAISAYSQALGYQSIARGGYSTAIGYQSIASGNYSTAIGNKSKSKGPWSFASGRDSRAYGDASTAMGDQARALGGSSVAMGCYSKAIGYGSAAIGYQSTTNGEFSTTMGFMTTATGNKSTAMGYNSKSIGDFSTAMGYFTYTKSYASVAIGRYNDTTSVSSTSWNDSDPLFIAGNGTSDILANAFTVYKNGNVYIQNNLGIGTITPSKKLEIGGTASSVFLNSATSNLLEYNMLGVAPPSYNTRSNGTKIALYPGVSATAAEYALGIDASTFWMSVPNNTGTFKFYSGTSEIMRIMGTGNVGIGTSSPTFPLEVKGRGRMIGDGTNSSGIWYSNLAGSANRAFIGMNDDNHVGFYGGGGLSNFGLVMNVANGNIGIGTNTPSIKLDVSGMIRATGVAVPTSGAGIELSYSGGVAVIEGYDRTSNILKPICLSATNVYPNTQVDLGSSAHRWNSVYAANGTIQTSDRRLKANIASLNYGLESIMKLNPVCFTWKDEPAGSKHLGLVAQEVVGIIDEVVDTGTDPDKILGINYSQLVPVLIKGMQDQQQQIESQKQENQQLKSELQILKDRMERMEAMIDVGGSK